MSRSTRIRVIIYLGFLLPFVAIVGALWYLDLKNRSVGYFDPNYLSTIFTSYVIYTLVLVFGMNAIERRSKHNTDSESA